MATKISATIVADSICPRGHRITTMELTMPRFILAELNTHRMMSKNSASSRAIPFNKMVEIVKDDPFIPIAWQKEHKGMQGTEYITDTNTINQLEINHLTARDWAILLASTGTEIGSTKQLMNRYLEPFMWHKVLLTSTEWENFFELRSPQYTIEGVPTIDENNKYSGDITVVGRSRKELINNFNEMANNNLEIYGEMAKRLSNATDMEWLNVNKGLAEIHMMALAEAMWDAMNESTPKQLQVGEWHIPYLDKFEDNYGDYLDGGETSDEMFLDGCIKISTGMAANTSYTIIGEQKEKTYETFIGIHDKMVVARPFHASPFEHCAVVPDDDEYYGNIKGNVHHECIDTQDGYFFSSATVPERVCGWFRNFHGWKQYRQIIEEGGK